MEESPQPEYRTVPLRHVNASIDDLAADIIAALGHGEPVKVSWETLLDVQTTLEDDAEVRAQWIADKHNLESYRNEVRSHVFRLPQE